MNFAELKEELTTSLEESSSAAVFWTQDDIENAINDAYEDMVEASGCYERRVPIQLIANHTYYDLFAHASGRDDDDDDGYIYVSAIWNPQTSRWLDHVTIAQLDEHASLRWEGNQGQPARFTVRGLRWLAIHPKPGPGASTTVTATGFTVTAVTLKFEIGDSESSDIYSITLTAGTYTAAELAAHLQSLMRTASGSDEITVSASGNVLTITKTAYPFIAIFAVTGADSASNAAWVSLGITTDHDFSLSITGDSAIALTSTASSSSSTGSSSTSSVNGLGYLDVYLTCVPPRMALAQDEPEFPSEFHQGILEGARCELYAQEREVQKALKYWNKYTPYIAALESFTANRLSKARTFIGGGAHA